MKECVTMGKPYSIIVFLLLVCCSIANAQIPHIQWQKTYFGDQDDELYSIQQTADGGYILGGFSNSDSSFDKTAYPCGGAYSFNYDFWVLKTDSLGNIVWQKDIGGGGDEILNMIRQTKDKGYILAGYTDGTHSCSMTTTSFGINDWWVIKLDSAGNIQWQQDLGGSCNDFLNTVWQTKDGGYILGGDSRSDAGSGGGNKASNICGGSCSVLSDYWVVKLDSAGNIKWQKDYGGSSDDNLNSVRQTADGGYILGGTTISNHSCDKDGDIWGDSVAIANWDYDYWVIKTDSVGNIQWQKDIGGTGDDELYNAWQTTDGGYILGGYSNSQLSGNKTSNTWGDSSYDYWIVKLDDTGGITWQKDIGGNGYDGLYSIQQTNDNGYILGGFSNSDASGDKTSSPVAGSGHYDYWVVKLGTAGSIQWQLDIGRDSEAVLYSIEQTTDGGYILGGTANPTSSNLNGKVNHYTNPYGNIFGGTGTHYWVVKLGPCDGHRHLPQVSICKGDSVSLREGYGPFAWGVVPGGSTISTLSCDTCALTVARPTKTTEYWVVSLSGLYCNDTAAITVVPSGDTLINRVDCNGNPIQLHAPVDDTGLDITSYRIKWSPATYLDNDTITYPLCTPLSDISYTIKIIYNGLSACPVTDTFNVRLLKGFHLDDTTLCKNYPGRINGNGDGAYSYSWSPPSGVSDPTILNPVITVDSSITYTVTASFTGCPDTVRQVHITAASQGAVAFTEDTKSICKGQTITFYPAYSIFAPSKLVWNFGDGSGYMQKDTSLHHHSYDNDGKMIVTLSGEYAQCPDSSFSDTITVYPDPVVNLGPDTTLCPGDPDITLSNKVPQPSSYTNLWNTGATTDNITVQQPAEYWLMVTSDHNCRTVDTEQVNTDCYINIPNAFTPDGDGENDYFFPRSLLSKGVSQFYMAIYNRWGEKIFETNNIDGRGWDGRFNGIMQPVGVYMYLINVTFQNGVRQHYQGNVTLISN